MNTKGSRLLGLGVFIWIVYKAIDRLLMPVPNGLAMIFIIISIVLIASGWVMGRRSQ